MTAFSSLPLYAQTEKRKKEDQKIGRVQRGEKMARIEGDVYNGPVIWECHGEADKPNAFGQSALIQFVWQPVQRDKWIVDRRRLLPSSSRDGRNRPVTAEDSSGQFDN